MPAFDLLCVGTGGGPDETNLSAYLFKPSAATWKDGILAIEAGSGQGALNQILKQNPEVFASSGKKDEHQYSAFEIYSLVRCYLITHAHLDHVNSLVMSAGSLGGFRKRIWATLPTLKDLESVFSDRLWPNLASWEEEDNAFKFLYSTLHIDDKYISIHTDVSMRTMNLNHGKNDLGIYESAAFFIRDDPSGQEFLFFGDVEPDSVADKPQNIHIWRAAAPKIPEKLSTLFIECSWPSGRPDDLLYGHLSPEHLVAELEVLATEVQAVRKPTKAASASTSRPRKRQKTEKDTPTPVDEGKGALDGLTVYVMHCKDPMNGLAKPSDIIVNQVKALVSAKGLGAKIVAAEQGMRIEI